MPGHGQTETPRGRDRQRDNRKHSGERQRVTHLRPEKATMRDALVHRGINRDPSKRPGKVLAEKAKLLWDTD